MSQPFDEVPEQDQVAEQSDLPEDGPQASPAGEAAPEDAAPEEAAAEPAQDEVAEESGTTPGEAPAEAAEPEVTEPEATEPEAAEPEAAEDAAAAPDPLEDFRESLRAKPGDWFVVHTYSGMENRVKANLENRITSLNMEDYIHEVVVPQEEVPEIKNGQRRMVRRTVLPGYVLVRMDLTDESWSTVRHTPSVTGFVGHSHQPVPLTLAEVENMLAPAVEEELAASAAAESGEAAAGQPSKKQQVEVADFAEGDSVMVIDGPFATLHATITEMNTDTQRVKALVEIFGRETPVDLAFNQIQRV